MVIDFGTKLTSKNFDVFYSKYYKQSFKGEPVQFDLTKLEWISIDLVTFWFAWMHELKMFNISISILLQESAEDPKIVDRRKTSLNHLIHHWQMQRNLPDIKMINGNVSVGSVKRQPNPFVILNYTPYVSNTFDKDFDEVFTNELEEFSLYARNLLKNLSSLNYFDNQYLSYSIIKEFYSNVCQHAYPDKEAGKAFISIKINRKISEEFSLSLISKNLNQRQLERSEIEKSFFLDTQRQLVNDDFIEMCFLDFGKGIANTLSEKYQQEDFTLLKQQLHPDHVNQNMDCRVLEYAFLLFTSKYELGKHFEVHNYIPRGLFIIKEIVSRYKGMIVAKSGRGRVVFDFSKGKAPAEVVKFENVDEALTAFKGTKITIILPTKKGNHKKEIKTSIQDKTEVQSIEAINLLNLVTENETSLSKDEPLEKVRFYERFFSQMASKMRNPRTVKRLILVDFAGIELRNNDLMNKLIYFFAFCPIVTQQNQLCLINVLDKGLNESLVFSDQLHLRNRGFTPKAIPVVHPDLSISWIGIKDIYLEAKLTEIWKNDKSHYEGNEHLPTLEGNVIELEELDDKQSKVILTIPNFWDLGVQIRREISKFITAEITNNGIQFPSLKSGSHNYNNIQQTKVDEDGNKRAFQTANGKYQMRFFSFIEKLYVREYRRGLACYLSTFLHFEKSEGFKLRGTKILTVTLSSQLLGKEFVDIINHLYQGQTNLELIPLSNYYDFNKEEPFEDIKASDRIIVVNDVISTGNLSYNIYHSLNERGARLDALLTLLDNRLKEEKNSKIGIPIISLLDFEMRKYADNPYPESLPVRINPILNSPTTMSRKKSGEEHILMPPLEFLRTLKDQKMLLVGQYKINTIYHYYFLKTYELFQSDKQNGYELINAIFNKFFSFLNKKRQAEKTEVDFVFYPFFSSVSELIDELNIIVKNNNGQRTFEAFPVPRIMTPKGWRFSFPPKHLNLLTQGGNKTALILDDGSCTGDTLMQLIDTLSFLELKEIYVLVLFARLEDFQREFYTKIKSIEVGGKKIDIHLCFGTQFHIPVYQKTTTPATYEIGKIKNFIEFYKSKDIELPGFIKDYIDFRKPCLEAFNPPNPDMQDAGFKDFDKRAMFLIRDFLGRYDSYRLFKEDEPGSDVPNPVNETLFKNSTRNLRMLTAVLVHEPYLIVTASRLYPEILKLIDAYFNNQVAGIISTDQRCSFDECYFLLKGIIVISPGKVTNKEFLYKLLSVIESVNIHSKSEVERDKVNILYGLLSFYLLENLTQNEKPWEKERYHATRNLIRVVWHEISEKARSNGSLAQPSSCEKESYYNVFRIIYDKILPYIGIASNNIITPFLKVRSYFEKLTIEGINHKDSTDYNNFEKLCETITGFVNASSTEEERRQFVHDFKNYKEELTVNILNHLEFVLNKLSGLSKLKKRFHIDQWRAQIQYLKEKISPNLNDDFITQEPDITLLQSLRKWFNAFNTEIISPDSDVSRFILSAKSDVIEIWDETIKEYNAAEKDSLKIHLENTGNVVLPIINMHPYILKLIFMHILVNRKTYAPESKCEYSAYVGERNAKSCLILYFKQYAEFVQKINGNRGLSDIRYMLDVYGGVYKHLDRENYTFEIVLPLNVINNE